MTRQLLALFSLFLPLSALADGSVDREAALLFESVMSPYCPGRTLSACPSEDARRLRDELRAELEAGKKSEQLRRELLNRFSNLEGKPSGGKSSALARAGLVMFFIFGVFMIIRLVKPEGNANAEEEG